MEIADEIQRRHNVDLPPIMLPIFETLIKPNTDIAIVAIGSYTGYDEHERKFVFPTRYTPFKEGPEPDVTLHEIGHFLIANEKRRRYHSWGLRFKSDDQEPTTFQGTELEMRVFAIQNALQLHFGYPELTATQVAGICKYLPDYWSAHLHWKSKEKIDFGDLHQKVCTRLYKKAQRQCLPAPELIRIFHDICETERRN
jgi:hypothetical protein